MPLPVRPLSDFGIIGNCRCSALVSRDGEIAWCCIPKPDSPALFSSILDPERGGGFSIRPLGRYLSTQRYLPDTNVLCTEFEAEGGKLLLTDCFSVAEESNKRRRLYPEHEILRRVECTSGEVRVRVEFRPRRDYGRSGITLRSNGDWGVSCNTGGRLILLHFSEPMKILQQGDSDIAVLERVLRAGELLDFSLIYSQDAPAVIAPLGEAALRRFDETSAYWRKWVARCAYRGHYEDQVKRSALALKLLTYAPSGAVLAAPTTSLPEELGGSRNWDYRFCWIRDSSFVVRALSELGYLDESKAYTSWLLDSTRLTRPELQVVYSIFGESKLPEKELPWLRGYADSKPVRVGNAASDQIQIDVYGEVLDAVWYMASRFDHVEHEFRDFLLDCAEAVRELWSMPDDGIWEMRGRRLHHTHSKVMGWVALDRADRLTQRFGWKRRFDYKELATRVHRNVEECGFDYSLGSYVRAYGEPELDASLLVLPLVGFCRADSTRMRGTVRAIRSQLGRGGLVYRYRPESDGLRGGEGAFGVCSFWLAEALARMGAHAEARACVDRMLEVASPLGLWSEEIDPASGGLLGNFPQAFTHIGLVNAAVTLSQENAA
jgi:GH15 family glucan-1,4-alpha-glucosidase